jgi:ribosomal protein S18 acetylase RimI-like enzyme
MEYVGSERKLYVMDLAIRTCARRLGLATAMLDAIEEYARNHDYSELYLHAELSNFPALYLYQKYGFVQVESTDDVLAFTTSVLPQPPESYVFLWKQIF